MLSQKTWLILRESQGVRLEEFSGIHSPFLQTKKLAVTHNMVKIDLKILNFWKSCLRSIKGQRKWNFMMSKKFRLQNLKTGSTILSFLIRWRTFLYFFLLMHQQSVSYFETFPSSTKFSFHHKWSGGRLLHTWYIRVASRVAERIKT